MQCVVKLFTLFPMLILVAYDNDILCVFMLLCFIYFTRNRSGSLMIQFDVIKFWQNFDMFYKMLH